MALAEGGGDGVGAMAETGEGGERGRQAGEGGGWVVAFAKGGGQREVTGGCIGRPSAMAETEMAEGGGVGAGAVAHHTRGEGAWAGAQ